MLELHAGGSRSDGLVLHAVLPPAGRQVHAAGLPRTCRASSTAPKRSWPTFASKLGIGHLADDGRRAVLVRRGRVSGRVRPRDRACRSTSSSSTTHARRRSTSLLDAMRAGTYDVAPMAQTEAPGAHVDRSRRTRRSRGRSRAGARRRLEPEQCGRRRRQERRDHARQHRQPTSRSSPRRRNERSSRFARARPETVDERSRRCRSLRC